MLGVHGKLSKYTLEQNYYIQEWRIYKGPVKNNFDLLLIITLKFM